VYTVTRQFHFSYAHRILGHAGKCRHLHGHNGMAEIVLAAPSLDELSMVVDFGVVKKELGHWIDSVWDHNILISKHDPLLQAAATAAVLGTDIFQGKSPFIFLDGQPTAENMAKHLHRVATDLMEEEESTVTVAYVTVWETEECSASYSPDTEGS
jgi:6-pyruvoyltetrahydropterin/6-carboxytetrahydropterin synthase